MKECINYNQLNGKKVQCRTCSHFCTIQNGGTGICGIRQNHDGRLCLLPYGKAIATNVDPVEKKPLYHFLPGSYAYSIGTLGCNFQCSNCQNYEISQIGGFKGETQAYEKINWGQDMPPKKIIQEAFDSGCQSIAYTYTEPTVFLEYALDTMRLAKEKGLKNIWVSNGFMSKDTIEVIAPYLDAVNVDIKSMDENFYQEHCSARLSPVLENCKRLVGKNIWLETTTLIIPTLTDSPENLKKIADFIHENLGAGTPWHISAFSGAISWKMKHLPDTPRETINQACQVGREAGLDYVYAGNIAPNEKSNTRCPSCGKILIKREGFETKRFDCQGRCPDCNAEIEGFFNNN